MSKLRVDSLESLTTGHEILIEDFEKQGLVVKTKEQLKSAISKLSSSEGTIIVVDNIIIDEDLTIPENVMLKFVKGGKLTVNTGSTLTINGGIEAGLYHIFDGDGAVTGNLKVEAIYPEWFGAKGDGTTDDSVSIQNSIKLADIGCKKVLFSNKNYLYTDSSFPDCHRVSFEGASLESSGITFTNNFTFGNGNSYRLRSNTFKNITFVGQIELRFKATDRLRIENCRFGVNTVILDNIYEAKLLFCRFDPSQLTFDYDPVIGEGTYDVSIIGCAFYQNKYSILIDKRVEAIHITDCWFEGGELDGGIKLGGNDVSPQNWQGVYISNNHFAPKKKIWIETGANGYWEHLVIVNNTFSAYSSETTPFININGGLRRSIIANNTGYGTSSIPYAIDLNNAVLSFCSFLNNLFDVGGNPTYGGEYQSSITEKVSFTSGLKTAISYNAPIETVRIINPTTSSFRIDSGDIIEIRNINDLTKRFILSPGIYLAPTPDNTTSLGTSSLRWTTVFATTGTINTSDIREKTIYEIEQAEIECAKELKSLIKKFKWNDAIEKKGEENARYHFGVIAQEVKQVFEKYGLDPHKYGLFCYDEWLETEEGEIITEEQLNENGKYEKIIIKDDRTEEKIELNVIKKDRYGIRYEELLCFIMLGL